VLAELRHKSLTWKEQLLPKHPMAEAVNYTLSQWAELTVFISEGAVPTLMQEFQDALGLRRVEFAEFPLR